MNETALNAMSMGSIAFSIGELAILAVEIPNNDAIGLAQTPTQAPLLQHAKNNGIIELKLPVIEVQTDFNLFILFQINNSKNSKVLKFYNLVANFKESSTFMNDFDFSRDSFLIAFQNHHHINIAILRYWRFDANTINKNVLPIKNWCGIVVLSVN